MDKDITIQDVLDLTMQEVTEALNDTNESIEKVSGALNDANDSIEKVSDLLNDIHEDMSDVEKSVSDAASEISDSISSLEYYVQCTCGHIFEMYKEVTTLNQINSQLDNISYMLGSIAAFLLGKKKTSEKLFTHIFFDLDKKQK